MKGVLRSGALTAVVALSSMAAAHDRVPQRASRYLKWGAVRGNDGRPPPQGNEWEAFGGHVSTIAYDRLAQPAHLRSVPLSGIHESVAQGGRVTLESIASDLVHRGGDPVMAKRAAANVLTGLPSASSTNAKDDLLLVRKDRVESYSSTRRVPNWVAWKISKSDIWSGSTPSPRNDATWRADPSLPAGVVPLQFHDYEGSGFDPGHMVASADRQRTVRDNKRTYITSNTLPQASNNNRGPWVQMENWIRNQVSSGGVDAYVMAGGTFGKDPYKIGAGVSVPNATWKIVVFLKTGESIDAIGPNTKVVAINVPNDDRRVNTSEGFQRYITTPAEIEKATGLRFFTNLPAATAATLRSSSDPALGVTDPKRPFPNTAAPAWIAPREN